MVVNYFTVADCVVELTTDDSGQKVYTLYTPLNLKLDDLFIYKHKLEPYGTSAYSKVLDEKEVISLEQNLSADGESSKIYYLADTKFDSNSKSDSQSDRVPVSPPKSVSHSSSVNSDSSLSSKLSWISLVLLIVFTLSISLIFVAFPVVFVSLCCYLVGFICAIASILLDKYNTLACVLVILHSIILALVIIAGVFLVSVCKSCIDFCQ